MGELDDRAAALWATIPRELGARFGPMVDALTADMIRQIQSAVPEYARPLEGDFGVAMTAGVRQAVLHSLETVGGHRPGTGWTEVFRQLGRLEFREGRGIDTLQTAYRVGARVAWRHVSEWGQTQKLPTGVFVVAAEAIFAFVEQLSALSVEGYTQARASAAGALDRRRRRLLDLLVRTPPPTMADLHRAAEQAQWRFPDRVRVVVLGRVDAAELTLPEMPPDVLADPDSDPPCLLLPEGTDPARLLLGRVRASRAVVGPTVAPHEAATSLRWASRTADLIDRGILDDAPITWCRDHLPTLWLLADEFLIGELLRRVLAPLSGLTEKQRARTADTLLAWLQTRGSAPEIAHRLRVHPQTVRYRMRAVEALFGDQMDDPDARLSLEIALRARLLLTGMVRR